jgi:hypothetical protein
MTARLLASRQTLLERLSPMLGEQTIVMHAEFRTLNHGALMQLWSDEMDAMRDEARQVVAAGMAAMAETIEAMGTPPTDRQARVQQYNAR